MEGPYRIMVYIWFLAILLGAFSCTTAPRSVIVGEPKQAIDNGLYVRVLDSTRVELKSIRWL